VRRERKAAKGAQVEDDFAESAGSESEGDE